MLLSSNNKKIIFLVVFILIYSIEQLNDFLELFNDVKIIHKNGTKKYYYNIACSFDIETSSFYIDSNNKLTDDVENGVKCSNMYIWQFAINDNIIYGRYWIQFIELIDKLHKKLNTNDGLMFSQFVNVNLFMPLLIKVLNLDVHIY